MARLDKTVSERPYLEEGAHRLGRWAERCRQHLRKGELEEARDQLARLEAEVELDAKRLRAAFAKFDRDGSGALEAAEARHLCVYLGFGADVLEEALQEGRVSLEALAAAVGRAGGVRALLERRRRLRGGRRRSAAQRAEVGARVRAHFRHQGGKSRGVRGARVLRCSGEGVAVEFGGGRWSASQEIPLDWIEDDVDLIEALNDIGILDDDQHCWTMTLPEAEQQVVKTLTDCQRSAISHVRTMATKNHSDALPELVQRAAALGIRQEQLWATLAWIRDSAPIIVHVELGRIGPSLLGETHYRNQFETQTTGGLICQATRMSMEHDLFVGAYDEAESFERPKYGVLDVMNDPRGVLSAQQYGDSYLVLTNARLRCTLSPEDSGGICASQVAVLDQYAHVLLEYGERELLEVVRVANAAEGSEERIGDSRLLENCRYREVQIHGEISLESHVARLVAHERHRADARHRWALRGGGAWPEADFGEQQVQALCAKQGWELVWMGDERLRRICEKRRVSAREDSPGSQGDFRQHLPHPEGARVPSPPNGRPRTATQEVTGGARSSADASFSLQSSGSLDSAGRLWERATRFGMGALSPAMREELSATLRVARPGEEPASG